MAENSTSLASTERLPAHPAQAGQGKRQPVTFFFDGKPMTGYEGDSVAAAMYGAGQRIFVRSFKYHRPRGLMCCAGRCPNCLVNVDGTPNVRSCTMKVREGMQVTHQNAWPSLENDALAVSGRIEKLMPVGFYYKTFMKPRVMWPVYEHFLKHVAGLGVVQKETRPYGYHHDYRTTEVAVVGGGPAGMAAALAAARAGKRVTIIDDGEKLGGMLVGDTRSVPTEGDFAGQPGFDVANDLAAELEAAGVAIWTESIAFGAYEGNQLGVQRGKTFSELRYDKLILASGAFERPSVFSNNDLPGIMLGTGAQRLLRRYGIKPGQKAVVATSHDWGLELAEELLDNGIAVAAVSDTRPFSQHGAAAERLRARGVLVHPQMTVVNAHGGKHLTAVDIASEVSAPETIECDLLCLSLGWEPAVNLLAQEGLSTKLEWDAQRSVFCVQDDDAEYLAAGSITGTVSLDECLNLGAAAGRAAAGHNSGGTLGKPNALPESLLTTVDRGGRRFVCVCDDVQEKDIKQAVGEGYDEIETLKRYATPSMGPCQGKMCRAAVGELCSRYNGVPPAEVGTSRARPPAHPITLGALGAGHAAPVRRTAMHHNHLGLGAKMLNLGEWKRPEYYTSAAEEVKAVRERVGLIDVGTLGKLEIRGADAGAQLEKLYTNRFLDLKVGRVRYGLVCDDSGTIVDDGTFARLGEDRWFVTTTTSGVDGMDQNLRQMAIPLPGQKPLDINVVNATAKLAAVNLAGPKSREVLQPMTDIDLSPEAFPYMAAREGKVLGVPAVLLRIGFVGELGYEIHYSSDYGSFLWDALLEAGKQFDIRPFGVEAQRILRLEKQHVIVSHDTDALSNPLNAGMSWVVKWDKEDFVGKTALVRARDKAQAGGLKLVGFTIVEEATIPEGCQVVQDGKPVGRITSYRRSPSVGKGIGIAWVPELSAVEGANFQIAAPDRFVTATTTLHPFYDPKGERLRA